MLKRLRLRVKRVRHKGLLGHLLLLLPRIWNLLLLQLKRIALILLRHLLSTSSLLERPLRCIARVRDLQILEAVL
jgi:hypothetical protein